MAIDTLTDLNNLITNGSGAERLAFKNIIVNGLNAEDLADIITSSTREQKEALAALVIQAEDFLNDTNQTAAQAARTPSIANAQSWYDTAILPALVWDNADTLSVQRSNSLLDRATLEGLLTTETDEFRLTVLRERFSANLAQFKAIKVAISQGG